jgi:hypothetical protein
MESALVIVDQSKPRWSSRRRLSLPPTSLARARPDHAGGVPERLARIRVLVPGTGLGRVGRLTGSSLWLHGR